MTLAKKIKIVKIIDFQKHYRLVLSLNRLNDKIIFWMTLAKKIKDSKKIDFQNHYRVKFKSV